MGPAPSLAIVNCFQIERWRKNLVEMVQIAKSGNFAGLNMSHPKLNLMYRWIPFVLSNCQTQLSLIFQCKFSNVPGGCKRPDCPYFHPGRSTQAGEGSRTFRDRLQRSASRSSREDDRSSPKDRLERGTKRNIEEVHEMHSAEGNKGR